MLRNDKWIIEQAKQGMIEPFEPKLIRSIVDYEETTRTYYFRENKDPEVTKKNPYKIPVLSYGVSSYGYDIRLGEDFRTFKRIPGEIVDPKDFDPQFLEAAPLHYSEKGNYFILPANSYGLGVSVERIKMPPNATAICLGKSTYSRVGVIANITPLEAAWQGCVTLEFSNASSADVKIYSNEGIVQLIFLEGEPCEITYSDREGKYQNQGSSVTLPKV